MKPFKGRRMTSRQSPSPAHKSEFQLPRRAHEAIGLLLYAFNCAQDASSPLTDFATERAALLSLGMNDADLRWLIRKGYLLHYREETRGDETQRAMRQQEGIKFTKKSCFSLTAPGVALAEQIVASATVHEVDVDDKHRSDECDSGGSPCWHAKTRELVVRGELVKKFRVPAPNQIAILAAFQEQDWQQVIDDPLPPKAELDARQRLRETIRGLNRNQLVQTLHFSVEGNGEQVSWQLWESWRGNGHGQ